MRIPKYIYLNPFYRNCFTSSPERHIFVVGPPRSGTTLLANVLANHSNLCSLASETNMFGWRSNFFLFEGGAGRNSYELNKLRHSKRNLVELFDSIAAECRTENSCERFVEKTPQHVFHIRYILRHFPESRIIFIYRDPRDGFVSSRSNRHIAQKSPQSFSRYWRRCVLSRMNYCRDARIIDLKYEDFVQEPEDELKRIMSFLGETFEPSQISPNRMSQNPRAGTASFRLLGGPISSVSIGRWRTELSANDESVIRKVAAECGQYFATE